MLKIVATLSAVVLLGYGLYLWALDSPTSRPQRTRTTRRSTRRDFLKVIQEKELQVKAAWNKINEFSSRAKNLKGMSARTLSHIQSLVEKETRVQNGKKALESKLRVASLSINLNEPIYRDMDGNILSPREMKPSSPTSADKLAECTEAISDKKQYFEKLHNRQIKTLRLASRRLQLIKTRWTTLGEKISRYRNQHDRSYEYEVDTDAYTDLCNEVRQVAGEIDGSLADYFSSVDSSVKQLFRDSSAERISSSSSSIDRALARVDTLLTGK